MVFFQQIFQQRDDYNNEITRPTITNQINITEHDEINKNVVLSTNDRRKWH